MPRTFQSLTELVKLVHRAGPADDVQLALLQRYIERLPQRCHDAVNLKSSRANKTH